MFCYSWNSCNAELTLKRMQHMQGRNPLAMLIPDYCGHCAGVLKVIVPKREGAAAQQQINVT